MEPRQPSAVRAVSRAFSMLLLLGCDPGYSIRGEIALEDPASLGKPLIVQVFENAVLDAQGLPVGWTPRIALATVANATEHTFRWGNVGCRESMYVMAWVDLDGSSNLESLLAATSFTDSDEQNLPRNSPGLVALRDARPSAGDPIAISRQLRFTNSGGSCQPASAEVALRPMVNP